MIMSAPARLILSLDGLNHIEIRHRWFHHYDVRAFLEIKCNLA
jgi:hypothetical protein